MLISFFSLISPEIYTQQARKHRFGLHTPVPEMESNSRPVKSMHVIPCDFMNSVLLSILVEFTLLLLFFWALEQLVMMLSRKRNIKNAEYQACAHSSIVLREIDLTCYQCLYLVSRSVVGTRR